MYRSLWMLGEMADALALASRKLAPRRLLETGYQFCFPEIEAALRHELAVLGVYRQEHDRRFA
jgi:NAD dependent epimerase/dehydratase family enzyme